MRKTPAGHAGPPGPGTHTPTTPTASSWLDGSQVHWPNSVFLVGTLVLAVVGVPTYLATHGLNWFQVLLFLAFFIATGLSITLGYHRLFSHLSFKASTPVRLATLAFGAAAFENSALVWAADHRKHHKFVDQDDDPYNINRGFFHAHIGWMLSNRKEPTTFEAVRDLEQDPLVRWQHRHYVAIACATGFALPTLIGWAFGGLPAAWGAFVLAGITRVVLVHHFTFLINSWSHTWGRRPYSTTCTARDSALLAWFTFGEGYHNFHHAFQHDYRNGVKPWHFDPTKWCIWLLHACGLAHDLRSVPTEAILLAEINEKHRALQARLQNAPSSVRTSLHQALTLGQERLQRAVADWQRSRAAYAQVAAARRQASREWLAEFRRELDIARRRLHTALRHWQRTLQAVEEEMA